MTGDVAASIDTPESGRAVLTAWVRCMVDSLLREHDKAPLLRVGVSGLERVGYAAGNLGAERSGILSCVRRLSPSGWPPVVLGHNCLLIQSRIHPFTSRAHMAGRPALRVSDGRHVSATSGAIS